MIEKIIDKLYERDEKKNKKFLEEIYNEIKKNGFEKTYEKLYKKTLRQTLLYLIIGIAILGWISFSIITINHAFNILKKDIVSDYGWVGNVIATNFLMVTSISVVFLGYLLLNQSYSIINTKILNTLMILRLINEEKKHAKEEVGSRA